jgi:F-type H+-transporting ATPase subunit b
MRINIVLPAVIVLAIMAFASGDAAAQPHGERDAEASHSAAATHTGNGHDGHAKPGLLDWDLGSAFWSVIVFLILMTILRLTAWKPILQALHQREQFITSSLESAKKERLEAERVLKEYTAQINTARQEATAIVEEGRRDAEAVRRRIQEEAKHQAQEILQRSQREIKIAQEAAVSQLYSQTLELATSVAGKIVKKQLTPADHRALLEESMAEIARAKH